MVVVVSWVWGAWLGCSTAVAPSPVTEGAEAPEPRPEPSGRQGRSRRGRGGGGGGNGGPSVDVIGAFTPSDDPCAAFEAPGVYTYDKEYEGKRSHTLLYVPAGPGPHDLVVVLHGGGSSPERILSQTRFVEQATQDGFAVLAPSAGVMGDKGPHWNSGKFDDKLDDLGVVPRDDVAYLDQLTRQARADVCASRVLAAGFSSGGQMVHRWGCEGKEPAAVLSAAGELLVDPGTCASRPVRGYVGTEDKVFDGPPLEGSGQPSAVQTIELWARINGCNNAPPETRQSEDAKCQVWQGCSKSTELCVIEGYPHGWPAPWSRKPTRCNATLDGMRWFEAAVPEQLEPEPVEGGKPAPKQRDRDKSPKSGRG
jgi:polyhydroxybutyrate depolymerase